jgi:hypothetical protein
MSENVGASTSRNPKGPRGLYRDNFTFTFLTCTGLQPLCRYRRNNSEFRSLKASTALYLQWLSKQRVHRSADIRFLKDIYIFRFTTVMPTTGLGPTQPFILCEPNRRLTHWVKLPEYKTGHLPPSSAEIYPCTSSWGRG